MQSGSGWVDVNDLMRQIRERVRQNAGSRQVTGSLLQDSSVSRLRCSAIELREALRRSSEPPIQPTTLRGRLGGIYVWVLRRMLSWQANQIRQFQTAAVACIDEQGRAVEALLASVEELSRQFLEERILARQERERLQALLTEEIRTREEFVAGCRSSLSRLEHGLLRHEDLQRRVGKLGVIPEDI